MIQIVKKVSETEMTIENGQGMNKFVTMLNPIDNKIIVIASFPERAFLRILDIITAMYKIRINNQLYGIGINKEIAILTKGRITAMINTSTYNVLLSNTILGLECDYINLVV